MSFIDLHTNVSLGHTKIVGLGGEKLWLCPTLGGDKLDISGNGNHGTYNGGIRTVADVSNGGTRAYSFDGVDDYIDVDNGITCGGHSVACWIYADTTSLRMRFIDSYDRSVSTTLPQNVIQHEANTGIRAFSQISGNAIGSFTSINASQWYHIVSVLDGSDLRFYIDGSLVDTVAYTPTPDVDWVRIGARNNGGERVDGRMDDIRIFDRALTTSEITHLASKRGVLGTPRNPVIKKRRIFYAPAAPPTTTAKAVVLKKPKPSYATGYARNASESANPNLWKGLVGAWMPSFGVTGNTLRDVSANGNDGTLTNMDAASDWVATSKGLALDFDGVNDYVLSESIKHDVGTGDFSWSVWFYPTAGKVSGATLSPFCGINNYSPTFGWDLNNNASQLGFYWNGWFGFGLYPNLNKWNHAVLVRKNYLMIGYLNGVSSLSQNRTQSMANGRMVFGRSGVTYAPDKFSGKLNDFYFYKRALSSSEIKQLYLNPSAPFERKQQTVGISTAQAFNPYWANQATQLAGTLQ